MNDVCVIPMTLDPHNRCRTNNRVRTALLLGLPVVATQIPSYEEFSKWMLAEDWVESIARYARDPDFARSHVQAAQEHIRTTYTPHHVVEQWSRALEWVFGRAG